MSFEQFFYLAQYGDLGVLYLLGGVSVISVAVIIERFVVFRQAVKQSRIVSESIDETITSGQYQRIDEELSHIPSLEGKALKKAVHHYRSNGPEGLEEVFDTVVSMQKKFLESHLSFLATVASNAPYVGLLGTVLGIMKALHDLASASNPDQKAVMAGISIALVATALGLFVAIPAVVAYNHFQKQKGLILQSAQDTKRALFLWVKSLPREAK